MDDSIAILGRQPALGLAELESLYSSERITPLGTRAARISFMPCSIDFARLGGTVKLCKILTVLATTQWKAVEQFLISAAPPQTDRMPEGKMHLGLSAYDINISSRQLMATGLSVKSAIQRHSNRTVRLVPNQSIELNAAQVIHSKLLSETGWELVFLRDRHKTIIAQTVFIQDIKYYTIRDRDRPKRDARVGMLPPKLAQIIINLATGPQEFTDINPLLSHDTCLGAEDNARLHAKCTQYRVLDPFCGTGVLLQEALLMGYKAYGTDLETRMITFAKSNLEWLATYYTLSNADYKLDVGDAINFKWQPPIDIVATETYLGRPLTAVPNTETLTQIISDCNFIIKRFLKNIHPQLKPGSRLCLAIPAWQVKRGTFRHLPFIDQISEIGYNRVSFKHVRSSQLLYYREDQIVARELLVIDKTKR